jgi:hypothetical protein
MTVSYNPFFFLLSVHSAVNDDTGPDKEVQKMNDKTNAMIESSGECQNVIPLVVM